LKRHFYRLPNINNALLAATVLVCACASGQVVSEQSLEKKLADIKPGVTAKAEIERLFGTEHGNENLRWNYSLSDTGGIFPATAATTSTNTRALITVRFAESGTVKGLEVERYFNPPFTNDYWAVIDERADSILELAARAAEGNN
jgi:hypothetical protein